ncbi:FecCD family ABC transporter permease [Kocuria rosea]|uniref:FecCD family ABC transporter permease n=1 Tax=Kocuria rosea TaxID=1275 RepID=UPI002540FC74|nr:iron ABC transporter permease [Kocuria rosea]WIG15830.1 iron ABC transporter permease [Kocuria rosea]
MTPTPTTPITHTGGATGHGTAATTTAPLPARRFRSVRALRAGPVSLRVHPRSLLIGVILLVAVAVTAAAHLAVGGTPIPYPQVLAALTGGATEASVYLAVTEFRAPRMVAAILVGACLAAAGAITQTVARNPLASPDILGVTAGASAGAVAVLILAEDGAAGLSGLAATVGMPVAAFTAGLISGVAAYLLAYRNGIDSYRLILVGLGISGFATAITTWMLTLGDVTSAAQALTWMMGSLNGKDWILVRPMAAVAVLLLGAAVLSGRWLLLAALDEDTAIGLGLRLGLIRVVALTLAVLLAAVATVVGGPLVFVALAAPQIARLLTRSPVPPVTVSALTGAVFVLVADTAAANLLATPLPVEVATAVLGAPYLIYLVIRSQRRPR